MRPDGRSNLFSYLQSGADNPEHGTRKPDLGAKLYVARPCVRREKGRNVFHGTTNTRLHCDLSDAVNYNSGEGDAIWTMFAAADRASELEHLALTARNAMRRTPNLYDIA